MYWHNFRSIDKKIPHKGLNLNPPSAYASEMKLNRLGGCIIIKPLNDRLAGVKTILIRLLKPE